MSYPVAQTRVCLALACGLSIIPLTVGNAAAQASQPQPPAITQPHPLDSLTAPEIQATTKVLKAAAQFPEGGQFVTMVTKEPAKSELLAYAPGAAIARQSFSVILDRRGNRTFEAVVDLKAGSLVSWKEITGVQPLILAGEYEAVSKLVKADPRWQAAMKKRNITDFEKVQIDGWAVGQVPAAHRGRRLLRALSYFRGDSTNFYGRPIEGVVAVVNVNTDTVVDVVDTGVMPLPPPSQELDETSTGTRVAPRPLVITQPNGASFEINGQEIRWQKWRFRYSMHPREGLVLHTVGYEDEGRVRPILFRGSLSEMVVPYGDTDRNWRWRSAFDVGEYSVGRLASSIEPKTDAPENATLIDATFAGDDGEPYVLPRAMGIYERDGGLLWKHYEGYSTKNESRRARQLVVFFIATIGNYDYALNWVFHQDGVIEADAGLSGIMLPKGVRETTANGHAAGAASGHLVAANVVAPHHQHFFSFRLDFDVDGHKNVVHEMNTRALAAGPGNPALNGMVMEETRLGTESAAQRRMNLQTARTWQVLNRSVTSTLGHHPSYILVPGPNALPYVAPAAELRRRAGFVNQHFWATRYHEDEMSAAGAYPNQSTGGDGLPRWVANNEPLVDEDVVVWYTLGVTHIPRPEEWPVMPVTHVGFKMIPAGFFTRNPALDVPR
jgi:primary-amine oxidase